MAKNTSWEEQLKYTVGLQLGLTAIAIIFTCLYTLPKMEANSLQLETTNRAISEYQETLQNGISYKNLPAVIRRVGNNAELSELVDRHKERLSEFLKKTDASKTYSDWLTAVMNTSEEDKMRLMDAQAKINSIIPTLSSISHNQTIKSVTLRDYVTFVEWKLLALNGVSSFSPIGITGVKYQEDKNGTLESPVGEFTAEFNFKATNGNIIKLLKAIYPLGDPKILSENSISSNPPAVMENPLVTIEELRLEKVFDTDNPNLLNEGRLVLKFYVRGSSLSDVDYLVEAFKKKKNTLATDISQTIAECEKNSATCVTGDALADLQKKFQKFDDALTKTLADHSENTIEIAYIIAQQMQSLQSLRQEFENIK